MEQKAVDRANKARRLRYMTGCSPEEADRFLLLYEAVKDIEAEAAATERSRTERSGKAAESANTHE